MTNKELSPLEALKTIKTCDDFISDEYYPVRVSDYFEEECEIIETALKKSEQVQKILEKYEITDLAVLDQVLSVQKFLANHEYSTLPREEFDLLFKKLKSLEIIKEKIVDVEWLIHCFRTHGKGGLAHYNNAFICCVLTQEEYDLLKEVLL